MEKQTQDPSPKPWKTRRIAVISLLSALIYIGSYLHIDLPGDTRIHLGNIMCLVAGLLLGPVEGGMASSIGSGLFDLTSHYIRYFPTTVVNKFLMAFVCGKIAYSGGHRGETPSRNFLAAVAGSATYILLYLGTSFIENYFFYGVTMEATLLLLGQKFIASVINGTVAVFASVPLARMIRRRLVADGQWNQ